MKTKTYISDSDDPVDIRKDNVFKAVFTRETEASKGAVSKLVSAIIGKEVHIETILTNEPPVSSLGERQMRFDINCIANETGERINIEMCFHPEPHEPVRLEYHAGKLFTAQDISGKDRNYNDLKSSYQISFLSNKRFFSDEEFFSFV